MNNGIKYSDLVAPDDSIKNLIAQLKELNETYSAMIKPMIEEAKELKQALQGLSPATKEQQGQITASAKKADDLTAAINRLKKAQAENAQEIARLNQLAKEQNAINSLNARQLTSAKGSYDEMAATLAKMKLEYQALGASEREAQAVQGGLKDKIAQLTAQIKEYNSELKKSAKQEELKLRILNNAKGSYNKIAAQYEMLKIKINAMGEADEKAADRKRKLEERAKALYTQMIKLQEATGKHTLSVGNYAKSWDGLRFSVFQVVRELPNAAVSLNTLFLALSNNIPILVDEINQMRKANEQLRAEGKPTQSVIKAIVGSLLSWNTALILLITAFTTCGDKIVDFIKNAVKLNNTLSKQDAIEQVTEEVNKNTHGLGENITKYKELQSQWMRIRGDGKKMSMFIKEHTSEWEAFGTEIKNASDADKLFITGTTAVIESFKARAYAAAAAAKATEYYNKAFQIDAEIREKKANRVGFKERAGAAFSIDPEAGAVDNYKAKRVTPRDLYIATLRSLRKQRNELNANGDRFFKLMEENNEKALEALKKAGLSEYVGHQPRTKKNRQRTPTDPTVSITRLIGEIEEMLAETEKDLMVDGGLNQKIAKIDIEMQKSMNKLDVANARIDQWLTSKKYKITPEQRTALEGLRDKITIIRENLEKAAGFDKAAVRAEIRANQANSAYNYKKGIFGSMLGLSSPEELINARQLEKARYQSALANANKRPMRTDILPDNYTLKELEEMRRKGTVYAGGVRPNGVSDADYRDEINARIDYLRELEVIEAQHTANLERINAEGNLKIFDNEQALDAEVFESYANTEEDKTRFALEQQKARIQEILKYDKILSSEEIDIYKAQLNKIDTLIAQSDLAEMQKAADFRFNSADRSDRDKALYDIQRQRAEIERQLANPNISAQSRDRLMANLGYLNYQEKQASQPKDIYDIIGLNLTTGQKEAVDDTVNYATQAINSLMQLEEAYAQKAVENANKRVDAAKNALQVEKEARANGYANNVEMAQKEYEASRKIQEKALRRQKQVQKMQIALDSAMQISNLVTASSGIWKQFPNPAIAIPMIAIMWASFAASKIMAAKAVDVNNSSEEYGEGTVELLQGGSHQSGNDIDLGTKADGTRRRAEGGEFFAVINKRNSRKYRREIPDIIHALNSGTFDRKYMLAERSSAELSKYISAYGKAGNITFRNERSKVDLSQVNRGISQLVKQGERQITYLSDGKRIETYKNVRRIIST